MEIPSGAGLTKSADTRAVGSSPRGPSLWQEVHLAIRLGRSLHGLRFVGVLGSCCGFKF